MKSLLFYVVALTGGAAIGAAGVGAYNVVLGGAGELTEAAADSTAHDAEGEALASVDPELQEAAAAVLEGLESGDDPVEGDDRIEEEPEPEAEASGEQEQPAPVETTPAPTAVAQAPPTADPDSLARVTQNYQRLARIFAAMKPDEAAPVLAQLDDDQLEGILLAMQGRNAAPILAEMDPERAASVSRRVLRGNE